MISLEEDHAFKLQVFKSLLLKNLIFPNWLDCIEHASLLVSDQVHLNWLTDFLHFQNFRFPVSRHKWSLGALVVLLSKTCQKAQVIQLSLALFHHHLCPSVGLSSRWLFFRGFEEGRWILQESLKPVQLLLIACFCGLDRNLKFLQGLFLLIPLAFWAYLQPHLCHRLKN